jgi:hypothetical protein
VSANWRDGSNLDEGQLGLGGTGTLGNVAEASCSGGEQLDDYEPGQREGGRRRGERGAQRERERQRWDLHGQEWRLP